jgi:hypothetical protein
MDQRRRDWPIIKKCAGDERTGELKICPGVAGPIRVTHCRWRAVRYRKIAAEPVCAFHVSARITDLPLDLVVVKFNVERARHAGVGPVDQN